MVFTLATIAITISIITLIVFLPIVYFVLKHIITNKDFVDSSVKDEAYLLGKEDMADLLVDLMALSIYDMYQKYEIVSFEDSFNSLYNKMFKLSEDAQLREKLTNEYKEYVSNRGDDGE